jgi:hypothetical protein
MHIDVPRLIATEKPPKVRHATHGATCRGQNTLADSSVARDRAPGGLL